MLCNLKKKNQIKDEIVIIRTQLAEAREKEREITDARAVLNVKKMEMEDTFVQRQVDELSNQLNELETSPDRKICAADIMEITKLLKQPLGKKEAHDVLWEVYIFHLRLNRMNFYYIYVYIYIFTNEDR